MKETRSIIEYKMCYLKSNVQAFTTSMIWYEDWAFVNILLAGKWFQPVRGYDHK